MWQRVAEGAWMRQAGYKQGTNLRAQARGQRRQGRLTDCQMAYLAHFCQGHCRKLASKCLSLPCHTLSTPQPQARPSLSAAAPTSLPITSLPNNPPHHIPTPPPHTPTGEASSVVLMGDRLSQVLDSVQLGRATLNKIRQNLTWALAYNVVGIPLAAGGCGSVTQDKGGQLLATGHRLGQNRDWLAAMAEAMSALTSQP